MPRRYRWVLRYAEVLLVAGSGLLRPLIIWLAVVGQSPSTVMTGRTTPKWLIKPDNRAVTWTGKDKPRSLFLGDDHGAVHDKRW